MSNPIYKYKGESLRTFCMNTGLNYITIVQNIQREVTRNPYLSIDEVIEIIMDGLLNGERALSMYKIDGKTVRAICEEKSISYISVCARFKKKKDEMIDFPIEERFKESISFFEGRKKTRPVIYIDELPLRKYCTSRGISITRVNELYTRDYFDRTDISRAEAFKRVVYSLDRKRNELKKLLVDGKTLPEICDEHKIDYDALISRYMKYFYGSKNISLENAIKLLIDFFDEQNRIMNQTVCGLTPQEYCEKKGVDYNAVKFKYNHLYKDRTDISFEDAIVEIVDTIIINRNNSTKYYYNNKPLKQACEELGINYSYVTSNYRNRFSYRADISKEEGIRIIVEELLEKKNEGPITIDGVPLSEVCKKNGIKYSQIAYLYNRDKYKDRTDLTKEEAYKEIISILVAKKIEKQKPIDFKDSIIHENWIKPDEIINVKVSDEEKEVLKRLSEENNFRYSALLHIFKKLKLSDPEASNDLLYEKVVKAYKRKNSIRKVNEIFRRLDNGAVEDINEMKIICKKCRIDFESLLDLYHDDLTYNQALKMIWYYSDDVEKDGTHSISDKKKEIVLGFVNSLKLHPEMMKPKAEDLITIYKCGLLDTRGLILKAEKEYLKRIMNVTCKNNGINPGPKTRKYVVLAAKELYLREIKRCPLNNGQQIIKFIHENVEKKLDIFVKWKFYNAQNDSKKLTFEPKKD